ncbi:septal ring lytic transglycosylase RlpA family protein [Aurantimonas sp. MSK8Z-1]|uniref:septal ring lytic transglycosylase RlpA family protein n=1 Tax=Mangrovibrevibacter kandeliae TaxID=2968473 RepID=UPI00211935CC|nr:septal ring lytic transglycosylase RlpA family protein [Aurantimonas sp. MSK8Z-1]MCW4114569.1 septal ring lytic transglycosylase RlpA family protein [Aurantimonas sp. MSK8Z-1]
MPEFAVATRRVLFVSAAFACLASAGCQSASSTHDEAAPLDKSKPFLEREMGVKASPRVTATKRVRKGGGREQVGKPYKVRGKWYYPKEQPGYSKAGDASWYGSNFHGRLTANGEVYDMYGLSAAHPTFPLPSYARVTNKTTGESIMVRVNDRGPYAHGRVIDVSERAAEMLHFKHHGVAEVQVDYVGRAPLEGDDTPMLMASYRPGDASPINDGLPTGVMIAQNDAPAAPAATAYATPTQASRLPGVRPLEALGNGGVDIASLIQQDLAADKQAAARTAYSASFAPDAPRGGAARALLSLGAAPVAAAHASTDAGTVHITLGTISNPGVLAQVRRASKGHGLLTEDMLGDGTRSLDLALSSTDDANAVLQALWAAGASDAFILRDD